MWSVQAGDGCALIGISTSRYTHIMVYLLPVAINLCTFGGTSVHIQVPSLWSHSPLPHDTLDSCIKIIGRGYNGMSLPRPLSSPLHQHSAYLLSCIDGVGDTAPHMVCWLTVLPLFVTVLVPEAGSDVLWCTSDPLGVYWQLAPLPSLYPNLLLSAIVSFLVLSLDLMDTSVGGDGTTLCLGMSYLVPSQEGHFWQLMS